MIFRWYSKDNFSQNIFKIEGTQEKQLKCSNIFKKNKWDVTWYSEYIWHANLSSNYKRW